MFGFLIGVIVSGFIFSDWLYKKVEGIESWFKTRKSMKLTEEEKKQFDGIQKEYINQIKKWDI